MCIRDSNGDVAAQEATQHMIETGSRRIAFIGGPNHLDMVCLLYTSRIVDDSEEEPRQEVDGKVAGLLPSHQHDQ